MAVQIRENKKKTVKGILNMDDTEILIEVDGFDEPITFKELFEDFDGKFVDISMSYRVAHKPE